MAFDLSPSSWMLFRNKRKVKDADPEFTGQVCLPDGRQMQLLGWVKEGKNGKFFSGKLTDMPGPTEKAQKKYQF